MAEVIAMKSQSKVFLILAALVLGTMTVAVAPTASAQVHVSGTFPLPHGAISFNVGSPYYGGYGYYHRPAYYGHSYYRPHYYRSYGYAPVVVRTVVAVTVV